MNEPFIIDAHAHFGPPGVFFGPEYDARQLLAAMDRCQIRFSIVMDQLSIFEGPEAGLPVLRRCFEESGGRLYYLGVFDPRRAKASLDTIEKALDWPGFLGIKIHPSVHRTPAEDPAYEDVWEFAAEHELPMLTHSWSVSDYNAVQKLSTPERFERYVRAFPTVRLVLGHAGGRGTGRIEAVRMANDYPNVYLDFAGDIFCHRLLENLVESTPLDKILFGTDFPWFDQRSHLTRLLLSDLTDPAKQKILTDNARRVYRIDA